MTERTIVQRLFESRGLNEASFESGGSKYVSAFGRYSKDGKPIDRDEYFKAKQSADSGSSSSNPDISRVDKSKNDSGFTDISSFASTAGTKMKNGKEGPWYADGADKASFKRSVSDISKAFKEKYPDAIESQLSRGQAAIYDEESGLAIVVKNDDAQGKSWCQVKKLTDRDKSIFEKSMQNSSGRLADDMRSRIRNSKTPEELEAAVKFANKYDKYLKSSTAKAGITGLIVDMRKKLTDDDKAKIAKASGKSEPAKKSEPSKNYGDNEYVYYEGEIRPTPGTDEVLSAMDDLYSLANKSSGTDKKGYSNIAEDAYRIYNSKENMTIFNKNPSISKKYKSMYDEIQKLNKSSKKSKPKKSQSTEEYYGSKEYSSSDRFPTELKSRFLPWMKKKFPKESKTLSSSNLDFDMVDTGGSYRPQVTVWNKDNRRDFFTLSPAGEWEYDGSKEY